MSAHARNQRGASHASDPSSSYEKTGTLRLRFRAGDPGAHVETQPTSEQIVSAFGAGASVEPVYLSGLSITSAHSSAASPVDFSFADIGQPATAVRDAPVTSSGHVAHATFIPHAALHEREIVSKNRLSGDDIAQIRAHYLVKKHLNNLVSTGVDADTVGVNLASNEEPNKTLVDALQGDQRALYTQLKNDGRLRVQERTTLIGKRDDLLSLVPLPQGASLVDLGKVKVRVTRTDATPATPLQANLSEAPLSALARDSFAKAHGFVDLKFSVISRESLGL